MLGNFKKMFIDKPNTNVNIPSGILESLAYNLPAGFSYTDVGKGFCVLKIPDGTQIKGRLRLEGASIENLKNAKILTIWLAMRLIFKNQYNYFLQKMDIIT